MQIAAVFKRRRSAFVSLSCVFGGQKCCVSAIRCAIDADMIYVYFRNLTVYVVSLLNYKLPQHNNPDWDTDHIISHYVFREKRTGEFAPPTISVTFVEPFRQVESRAKLV